MMTHDLKGVALRKMMVYSKYNPMSCGEIFQEWIIFTWTVWKKERNEFDPFNNELVSYEEKVRNIKNKTISEAR